MKERDRDIANGWTGEHGKNKKEKESGEIRGREGEKISPSCTRKRDEREDIMWEIDRYYVSYKPNHTSMYLIYIH